MTGREPPELLLERPGVLRIARGALARADSIASRTISNCSRHASRSSSLAAFAAARSCLRANDANTPSARALRSGPRTLSPTAVVRACSVSSRLTFLFIARSPARSNGITSAASLAW